MNANDWATGTIEDAIGVNGVFSDGDWVESKDQDPDGEVRLIQLADIGDGWFRDRSNRFLTPAKAEELGCTYLKPGDVLIARMPDPLGRACIFPDIGQSAVTAVDVCIVRPGQDMAYTRWLMHMVNSPEFRVRVAELQSGTTRKRISRKNLATIDLPLPPIEEQRRIVEAIEAHLSHLDAGVESLERAKRNVERMRLAALDAAMSGRLVAQDSSDYPVDLEGKIDPKRPRPDVSSLDAIPEKWTWVWLDELGELGRGKSKHRPRNDPNLFGGPYPFIQTGEIANASTWITSHGRTYSETGLAQSRLWPRGTVCITIAANIAESALLSYPACFPDSVVGLLVDSDVVNARFAELFIRTAKSDLAAYAPATAQKNINLSILSDVAVPVPPRREQDQIVDEVDRLFSILDSIEATAKTGGPDKLRSAVLGAAFSGRLVSW